ncbi:MAG: hypothetical protein JOZ16_12730 [Methylobacteriaceae bacterium]|nr:hypothetical protein [Methylobacteriaceae bacterium]
MKLTRRSFTAGLGATPLFGVRDSTAAGAELAVSVTNHSEPEVCAEKDNVQIDFLSPDVRRMRVRAVHPAYIGSVGLDRAEPDWTACNMSGDASFPSPEREARLWSTPDFWLVGWTYPSFWREQDVPVRIGDRVERGFHLVQLWMNYRGQPAEVLVFYPRDGYWRARPLPFGNLRWTAYGSSFLIGPVETQERPLVAFKEVAFDPKTLSFDIAFVRGGSARIAFAGIDQSEIKLDVTYSGAMPDKRAFASLRSMFTSERVADVTRVAWRAPGASAWDEAPVMNFSGAPAVTELWAGRRAQSRHNLSAPDMIFSHFASAAAGAT